MDKSLYAVDWPWWTRDGEAYFREGKLQRVDIDSFQPLSETWARDAKRVYCGIEVMRGADPASFVVLNSIYGRDHNHVYTLTGAQKEIDASTFVALGPTSHWFNTYNSYGKDEKRVYHLTVGGKACVLKNADAESFNARGNGFGSDKSAVYFERNVLSGADPGDWEHLRGPHSRSGKRGYCLNKRIRGADGRYMESLPILGSAEFWSRDANGYYRWDEPREAREYLDVFRDCFIFVGKVSNVELTYRSGFRRFQQLPADRDDSWMVADRAGIRVDCEEWLQKPDIVVEEVPQIGGVLQFWEVLHVNLLSPPTWMNENRIWIFRPTQDPMRAEPHLELSPFPLWSEYLSMNQLDFIKSLIREASSR